MKRNRILSLILAAALMVTIIPETAFASEAAVQTESEETSVSDEAASGDETVSDEDDADAETGSTESEADGSTVSDEDSDDGSDAADASETEDASAETSQEDSSSYSEEEAEVSYATLSTLSSYTSYSYSYSYTTLNSVTLTDSDLSMTDVLNAATDFIISEEGTYSSVTADDNGALSLGVLQWHGANALVLMRLIVAADNETAYSTLGSTLYNEIISSSTSWSSRTLTSSEVTKFSSLLNTTTGQNIQTLLAKSYVSTYLNNATSLGIKNAGALLIYADVANQRGTSGVSSTASTAKTLAGSYGAVTANEMLMSSIYNYSNATYYSSFVKRRFRSYAYIVDTLGWDYCSSGDILIAYSYETAVSTATTWLQYALNAVSDAGLTVDGSYGSLTQAAVLAYQETNDLDADGLAGPLTLAAIITDLVDYLLDGGTLITDSDDSSSGTTEAESTLAISSYNYPTSITAGSSFSIYGTVTSNYTITDVTVSVLNSSGSTKLTASAAPNAASYSIANLDSKITFGSLSAGTYTYVITATDSKTTKTLVSKSFTVTAAASTLKISSYNYPTTIKVGSSYSIKGTIKSNYKITKVTVKVVNSSGKTVLSASASPNSTSYSIAKLDSKIKFGSLSAGTYTYKVTATDTKKSKTLVSKTFKVRSLTISSYNYPTSIKKGSSFSIKGTVKSSYKITKVTVKVVDSDGNTVLSASAKPNAKSYSIKKLDSKIKFGKLSKGTYTYKVIATDTKTSSVTLLSKSFKVK